MPFESDDGVPRIGTPVKQTQLIFGMGPTVYGSYDAHPGGDGFVILTRPEGQGQDVEPVLVTGWFDELRKLAPAGR